MKYHHIRNATGLLELGEHRLLIDPMLSDPGALAGFKVFGGGRRRNPLVPLPDGTDDVLAPATGALVTHEHPDHFDKPALAWLRERNLPVWTSRVDVKNLRRKGLDARTLEDGALGMKVEVVAGRHGRGFVAWVMGPVSSFYLAHSGEPSVFLTGDTVLTDDILAAVERLRPDVVVAPAGAANFGAGSDLLFSVDQLVRLAQATSGAVVFNHLEALDHCATTRADLQARMTAEGLAERVWIPEDGEARSFSAPATPRAIEVGPGDQRRPGFQKWLTAFMAGT